MSKKSRGKLIIVILAFVVLAFASIACNDLDTDSSDADLPDAGYNPETFDAEFDAEGNAYCPRSDWESTPTPDEQEFYQNRD